jgi:octaprenyl-diphosphate synthase
MHQPSSGKRKGLPEALVGPLAPAFADLSEFLKLQVNAFEPEVRPLVDYCLGHSGKQLRPLMVFSVGLESDEAVSDELLKAAAIVELVHLATLVHDDILDEAELRHRTETVVARYGAHAAVLLGDALFAHALNLAAEYPDVTVCRVVSQATRQVCSGEIAQTFARGESVPDLASYFRMIDLKTAELFAASAYLGAHLAGFDAAAKRAASAFARHLGIAYQIFDDAVDLLAKETAAGKTLGTDLDTGKYTLPVLYWLDAVPAERVQRLAWLKSGEIDRMAFAGELRASGILHQLEGDFAHQLDSARKELKQLPGSRRCERLDRFVQFVDSAWNKVAGEAV